MRGGQQLQETEQKAKLEGKKAEGIETLSCVLHVAPDVRIAQAHGTIRALNLGSHGFQGTVRPRGVVEDGGRILVDPGLQQSYHSLQISKTLDLR